MEISITNLWVIYFVSLIVIALVMMLIVYKSGNKNYSWSFLVASILSALIVYLVAYYNVESASLNAQDKSSLQALYLTAVVVVALAFIWCIASLAMNSSGSMKKHKEEKHNSEEHVHVKAKCDMKTGKCKEKVTFNQVVDDEFTEMKFKCNDDLGCSPSKFYMSDNEGNSLKIKYLA